VKAKNYALSVLGTKTTAFMEFLRITPASQFDAPKGLTKYDAAIAVFVIVTFCATMALYGRPISEAVTIFFFAGNTVMRIAVAYAIAVIWTTAFAIFFARNKEVIKTLMPVFDVLQSIPAIAVFPIIVVFVINIIGGQFGLEIACLLLLLTGTQWYLLFNLIRAVQNVPGEIMELSDILRMKNMDKIRHVMLPAIYPALIIGSMQAIGGAWNASIVSEYLTYNGQVYHVNGLAYLLDLAATKGDLPGLVLTVMMMIAIIIFLNKVVWRNALKHSDRYTF
jgi:NitT/TauT family transport system permease protein